MTKFEKTLKVFDIAKLVCLGLATVLVFVFQFTGSFVVAKLALSGYVAAFILFAITEFMNAQVLQRKIKEPKIVEDDAQVQVVTVSNQKKSRVWSIIWVVVASVMAAVTLVVTILL